MIVKEVDSVTTLTDLLQLRKQNTYFEYDCDLETLLTHFVRDLYPNPNVAMMVMYDVDRPVGYMIVLGPNELKYELTVLDVFFLPEYQGKALMRMFFEPVNERFNGTGFKRWIWHSHVFQDSDFWKKFTHGLPVHEYKMFYFNMDGSDSKPYTDRR